VQQRTDDFNPNQPRAANGQFGEGGGGAASKESGGNGAKASNPKHEKAKKKYEEALAEYETAKTYLAYAKGGGDPETIAKAQAQHKYAMNKTSSAKHVMKKLEAPPSEAPKAEAPKAEAPKAEAPKAPEPKPDPPAPEPPKPEPSPIKGKAEMKYEAALKEYDAAKEALAEAKKSGDAAAIEKAKAQHKYAMNKTSSAKHVMKKLSDNEGGTFSKAAPAKTEAPKPTAKETPKAPAPHLEHGNTVKVAGATEAGGPKVGTVVGWNTEGTHTAILQLGKTEAEWHPNEKLSAHTANSSWAKEQEAIGKQVAKELGPGKSSMGPLNLEAEVGQASKAAAKEKAQAKPKKPTPQVSSSSSASSVSKTKAGPELVKSNPHAWGTAHYSAWKSSLTSKENSSIVAYSGSAYHSINSSLRKGDASNAHVAAIDAALAKSPGLPHDTVLKRGMGGNFPVEVGMTYHDKGYMSTSVSEGFGGSNKMVINAPKGSKGAYLVQSSHPGEKEFLLPRGSQIKVTKVETIGGVRYIHGDLMPDVKLDQQQEWESLTEEERERLNAEEPEQDDLTNNPKFISTEEDFLPVGK
jgi:hypothetical protein